MCFTTFRHRTRFYRAKKKFKKSTKVKLDLTENRHNVLLEASKYCNGSNVANFGSVADVNCRLKIKWADENEEDAFFSCMNNLIHKDEN